MNELRESEPRSNEEVRFGYDEPQRAIFEESPVSSYEELPFHIPRD